MEKNGKKVRRKIRISGIILIILVIYLVAMCGYYLFTVKIKSINVKGLNYLTENEVLTSADIDLDTSIFKVLTSSTKKKIEKLPLVKNAKVHINFDGEVVIEIEENKILFLNALDNKIVLEKGKTIANKDYKGVPILVNYVKSEAYDNLVEALGKIDRDILYMISEIEYKPDEYNGLILDEERFLLRMNDGNLVFINNVNIEKLNKYQSIYASVGSGGVLYLDSNSDNYIFNIYTEDGNVTEQSGEINDEN